MPEDLVLSKLFLLFYDPTYKENIYKGYINL